MKRKDLEQRIIELENLNKQNLDKYNSDMQYFAKNLLKATIKNAQNNTSANKATTFSKYKKEDIIEWLKNPASNEKNLRDASIYMYLSSMHYQRLISYYSNLYTWAYIISPVNFDRGKIEGKKVETFKKQYLKSVHEMENLHLKNMGQMILTVALREGTFYGIRVSDGTTSIIQRINPDICKISSMVDGVFLYSVDMSKIGKDKLSFYPQIISDLYAEYEKDKQKWKEIPMDVSVCVKADTSILEYSIPCFASTMPSLYTIENASQLQETKDELNNYKMLAGQVPTDDAGKPLMSWDLYLKYYNHLANAVGDGVGLAISPFNLKSFDFEQSGSTAEIDNVSRAINNYWTTAGTSGLLHGVTNNTSGVTKLAIKNDENYIIGIIEQIERLVNLHLKTSITGSFKFKISILPVTIYNREEFIEMYKGAVAFGLGKSHYAAVLGIPQGDIEGLSYLENDVLQIDSILVPMTNSHNSTGVKSQGRPQIDEEDLSDGGEKTRDNDSNSNQ